MVVLTSLPQPFFLDQFALANAGKSDRWDRRDCSGRLGAHEHARVLAGYPEAISKRGTCRKLRRQRGAPEQAEDPLRSYALLLLAEKADPAFIPTFMEMLGKSADPMRGDILRALGFFHDTQTSRRFLTICTLPRRPIV